MDALAIRTMDRGAFRRAWMQVPFTLGHVRRRKNKYPPPPYPTPNLEQKGEPLAKICNIAVR
jgi:hypothetical protein